MHVLHIHSGNLYGGVETLLTTLAREGAPACPALTQDFALCFDGRLSDELRAAGAAVHMLGAVRVRSPLSVRRARRALAVLLERESYDAAICHSPWSQAIFAPVVRSSRLPLVYWMHNLVDGKHWLERWARLTTPDLVICNTEFTATSAPRLYPHARTEVVYCPVTLPGATAGHTSVQERAAVRSELETGENNVVIIQVSRMEAWKGHTLHLEALSLLRDVPNWTCWMVGGAQRPAEAAYLDGLKRRAHQLGIANRVRFAGTRTDVPRLLAAADIFCQPNTGAEPFGIVFIEALASSLPVVATAIGGACEIVDDSCGLLVPAGDAHSLAASLRMLIENPGQRAELGARGPARARKLCDPSMQLQSLSHLFEQTARREVAA